MGPLDLEKILKPLSGYSHPDLLVGLKTTDDAAVFELGGRTVVQTVDFFAPVVDDPYSYGAIAAANSMSDIYAMGGEVLFALNIAAFPEDLPQEIVLEIVRGGAEKIAEGGGVVIGGHTVIDREPKFGFCVTGTANPDEVTTKDALKPGDYLVLTKPIGTGAITTAHKADRVAPAHLQSAIESMLTLNRGAARLIRRAELRAVTDITGFGLLGHSSEMAVASGVRLKVYSDHVPLLPGAQQYAQEGMLPGGVGRNRAWLLGTGEDSDADPRVEIRDHLDPLLADLLMDPETSGGLLAGVPEESLGALRDSFDAAGLGCWVVGEVLQGSGVEVV